MRRRAGVAAATGLSILLLAACGTTHGTPSPTTTSATSTSTSTSTSTPAVAGGAWSKPIVVAPGAVLSVVSCPEAGLCLVGTTGGVSYRISTGKVASLGPVVPSPSPQGVSYLSCTSPAFCASGANLNQITLFNGTAWSSPVTIPSAQGFTAIDCVGTTFCMTIDGEGNSFEYNGSGWSGNLGAWGAANQISCVSPQFCVAAEGGPSVWDGRTWTQPNDADAEGQLNSVSCASATFCIAVDSDGNALTWNGTSFSAPVPLATEPPLSGTDASGLTGVSCPTPTFCRAVDSIGRVFDFNGTSWTAGTLIDAGNALTGISCPTVTYCMAVDRAGRAFVASTPSTPVT
jgi:hypothetical protein